MGLEFANTIDDETPARNVKGLQFANMVENETSVRSVHRSTVITAEKITLEEPSYVIIRAKNTRLRTSQHTLRSTMKSQQSSHSIS